MRTFLKALACVLLSFVYSGLRFAQAGSGEPAPRVLNPQTRRSPARSSSLRRKEGKLLEANHWDGMAVAVELRYGKDLHQP